MSAEFSSKLIILRQKAGISQKQAATELDISQALLSHYEKGIRECSLDFVVRAAGYYNVSADYMLGSGSAKKADALTDPTPITSDRKPSVMTVLRAMIQLSENAERASEAEETFFTDFFSVCVKKYLSALSHENNNASGLCDLVLAQLAVPEPEDDEAEVIGKSEKPECIETSTDRADALIRRYLDSAF